MKEFIINNKDIIFNLINILLIVIGWLAVFWLGLQQQKKQLRNSAQMKVYEELYQLKLKLDEVCSDLGLLLSKFALPFLSMSFEDKSNIPKHESNLKALKHWQEYQLKVNKEISRFTTAYLKLWNHSDMWVSTIPQLKKAKKELFEVQLKQLTDELYKYARYLQDIPLKQFDWQKWNKQEIEQEAERLNSIFNQMAIGYIDDYLGLIHNRLVTPIFGHKKIPRENFANMDKLNKYNILTENGLKEIKSKKKR